MNENIQGIYCLSLQNRFMDKNTTVLKRQTSSTHAITEVDNNSFVLSVNSALIKDSKSILGQQLCIILLLLGVISQTQESCLAKQLRGNVLTIRKVSVGHGCLRMGHTGNIRLLQNPIMHDKVIGQAQTCPKWAPRH